MTPESATQRPLQESRSSLPTTAVAAVTAMIMAQGLAPQARANVTMNDFAGEEPTKLPEVRVEEQHERQVSSPKFTAPLVDTPQTVSVITSEVFTQQGGSTLSDVLRNTPGITFLAGEGGNASSADGDSFFMRGFDSSNSVFIDGVRDTGQYTRDVYNLEQVEIAKGPAGADIGRGSASGYINLGSKVPRLDTVHAGTVSYGSEDKVRVTSDFNQTLSETAAVRVNAMWQDGGVAGRDTVEQNRWSIAPSFALGLGTPTRAYLSYQYTKHDDIPDYGLPRAALPGPLGAGSFDPVPAAVDQDTFYGTIHDFDDVESNAFTARVEHDFSPTVKLSNQTRLSETDRLAILTAPTGYTAATGLVTRSRQGNERENVTVSNLTNLNTQFATGTLQHSLSAGFEYLYEKQLTVSYASVSDAMAPGLNTSLTAPDTTTRYLDPVRSGANNWGGIETVGVYAFDTVRLNDRWQATGGFRWETYEGKYRSVATTGVATRLETDDDTLSWKAGLVYKPAAYGSIYAAYGTSVRPPGANFSASTAATNADNLSLDPQEAFNYELGTKWDFFRGRLSTTAAVFRSENTKVASTDAVTGEVVQQNDQIVQGIELGASGRINDAWLVFGGLSYLDTEYSAPATSANASTDGAQLQWTPKWSGNVWTTYRLPFGLTLGGGVQYTGTTARQTTNTPAAALPETPDYWLVNAMASYPVTDRLTLRLNVNNVLDEEYLKSLNNNANRYNPGTPRSFIVSADVAF
ncbi:MAG TPA: TonB-dependent siderophore receptor [Opitutaceae bacterium]